MVLNTISRYIIREHQPPFFFSLAVIMFVFVTKFVVQYIGRLFGKGLSTWTILEFVYLNLAWMAALAVPMSVLIASLMAFGRLSADNEITILKTSGINLYRIISPALVWALALTVAMVWYNDQVLPEYNHQARKLSRSIGRKKPTFTLEEGLYLKQKQFNILVEEIERPLEKNLTRNSNIVDPQYDLGEAEAQADRLNNITIFDASKPNLQRTITARHGYLLFDERREQLVFHLFNGGIHEINTRDYSEYRQVAFTKNVFYIPASEQVFKEVEEDERGDREMSIDTMRAVVRQKREDIVEERATIADRMERFLVPADTVAKWLAIRPDSLADSSVFAAAGPDSLGADSLVSGFSLLRADLQRRAITVASRKTQVSLQAVNTSISRTRNLVRQIYKFEVEIYKKYSIPFACIVFVLIGAPLGIRARKGSLGVGVAFSIGFFLLYWVCLIGGEDLADRQLVKPWMAMWFPNIVVGAFGIYMTVRTVRETRFINWDRLPKFMQPFFRGAGG